MKKPKIIDAILLLLFILIVVLFIWGLLTGCDSQGIKDELANIQKSNLETKKAVKGNNNLIQEQITTVQETNTLIKKTTQQIQKGVGVKAESIEELKNSVKNVNNSSLLMIGIIVAILAFSGGIIYFLLKRTVPGLPIPTGTDWYKDKVGALMG